MVFPVVMCESESWTMKKPPLPIGFFRQEYWSGLPFPPPGDLPDPGIEPRSPTLQADSLPFQPPGKTQKSIFCTFLVLLLFLMATLYFISLGKSSLIIFSF